MASAVAELPLPAVLRYPLATPVGRFRPSTEDRVQARLGDVIAERFDAGGGTDEKPVEVLRAAASGHIERTPTALLLHPDGGAERAPPLQAPSLVERTLEAGIVGLGGAGYPTHLKLRQALERNAHALIVNAVECEAGVNADRALLNCHADDVLHGIHAVADALGAPRVTLAVSAPLPSAIDVATQVVDGPYPAGWERALTQRLLGVEAPPGGYPTDVGVLVLNVATVFAIGRAWRRGEPLTQRVVTVGQREFWVRIGHPVAELPLPPGVAIVGGPVTGWPADVDAAVGKTTRAVTPRPAVAASPCIRCGWCATACPQGLLPQELWHEIAAGRWAQTERLRLADCIECGACDLACPSQLPLLAALRHAKSQRMEAARRDRAANLARTRFEARNARLAARAEADRAKRANRLQAPRDWMRPRSADAPRSNQPDPEPHAP